MEAYPIKHFNPRVYDDLIDHFKNNIYSNAVDEAYGYSDMSLYQAFRAWLLKEYNCYNDGSNTLSFKTESDYMWFLLTWK